MPGAVSNPMTMTFLTGLSIWGGQAQVHSTLERSLALLQESGRLRPLYQSALVAVKSGDPARCRKALIQIGHTPRARDILSSDTFSLIEEAGIRIDAETLIRMIKSGDDISNLSLFQNQPSLSPARIDPQRKRNAFKKALEEFKEENRLKRVGLRTVADHAHQIYCKGLRKDKRPRLETFRNYVSGKWADPEIVALLQAYGVQGRVRRSIDPVRRRAAFEKALEEFKRENRLDDVGTTVVAVRAHQIYFQGLPEDQRPSLATFMNYVSGSHTNPEIVALLQEYGVKSKAYGPIVRMKMVCAIEWALMAFKEEDRLGKVGPTDVTERAYKMYGRVFPDEPRPLSHTFKVYMRGKQADPEIVFLLQKYGVRAQVQQLIIDPLQRRAAFEKALEELKGENRLDEGEAMLVADHAHQIYCQGLPEEQRPSLRTFQNYVSGKGANPEIVALLQDYGVKKLKVDKGARKVRQSDRLLRRTAFERALEEFKEENRLKRVRPSTVADRAHQIYCQGLPEEQRPRLHTFRGYVMTKRADPEIVALLQAYGVQGKVRQSIDPVRRDESFKKALEEFKEENRLKSVRPRTIANRAHQIYCQGLPEDQRPSLATFMNYVYGITVVKEILQLLEEAGIRKLGTRDS